MKLFLMNLPVNQKARMRIQFQFIMINHIQFSKMKEIRGKGGVIWEVSVRGLQLEGRIFYSKEIS